MNLRHRPAFVFERSEDARPIAVDQEVRERFNLNTTTTETTATANSAQLYSDHDFANDICPVCRNANEQPLLQPVDQACIDHDFHPRVYFSLSLLMGNSSLKHTLLSNLLISSDTNCYSSDDQVLIQQLVEYAAQLADNINVAEEILTILHDLLVKYTLEGMEEVVSILKQKHQQQLEQSQRNSDNHNLPLHLPRELKFISACLNDVSNQTFDLIWNQVMQEEPIDLQKIIFTDVRYARLLPLLCIIYESRISSLTSSQRTIGDDFSATLEDEGEDEQPASTLQYESNEAKNEIVILSSSDTDIRPMSNDSFDPYVLSLGVRSITSPLRSSQQKQRSLFTSQIDTGRPQTSTLSTPYSSQSERPSQTILEEEDEIIEKETPNALEKKTKATATAEIEDVEAEDCAVDMPDYDILSTPELKAKLKSYGFKTSNNRAQMIEELKRIYMSVHRNKQLKKKGKQAQSSVGMETSNSGDSRTDEGSSCKRGKRTRHQSVEQAQLQSEDEEIIDLVNSSNNADSDRDIVGNSKLKPDVREKIIQHLKANKDLWIRILSYEPVSVEECQVGLKCKKNEIKAVLDEVAAAKGTGSFHAKKKQKKTASMSSPIPPP